MDIKPCPFCGGPAVVGYINYYGDKFYVCADKQCTADMMIKEPIWQSRPIEDGLREQIRVLEDALALMVIEAELQDAFCDDDGDKLLQRCRILVIHNHPEVRI
jgi:ssDNA-binding Zn-finger/Zn-ribbon topoisomerase 1